MISNQLHQKISIIVPIYNEAKNVCQLHQEILTALKTNNYANFEIIFINDGSTDDTLDYLTKLTPLTVINFRKNFGQTAALDAGIKFSTGEVIVTLDGDLQNDPAEIPNLINKLNDGYDVVSGWRWPRHDPLNKKLISAVANILRRRFANDNLHDSGCTLKAYRRHCFDHIDLYGEMHRFIPAILKWHGFKITEIKVSHRPRIFGYSKYNFSRTIKGFVDMISIWFWRKFSTRPLHIFGGAGLIMVTAGFALIFILFFLRLFGLIALSSSIWPLVGFVMILVGIQLFISGLLADIINKSYFKIHSQRPYTIKEIIHYDN